MFEPLMVGLMAVTFFAAPPPLQVQSKPDISLDESRKISPYPPAFVKVSREKGKAKIEWREVPLARIVAYDIFKSINNGSFKKIARVKAPPFIDKSPGKGKIVYAVASVDYYNHISALKKEEVH